MASPDDNTAPPSEAKRLLDNIQSLLGSGGGPRELRTAIVTEELGKAYGWMRLRVDRLDRAFVVAGGQTGGEYEEVAQLIANPLAGAGLQSRAVATAGSFENITLIRQELADVGIVQSDVAAAAANG